MLCSYNSLLSSFKSKIPKFKINNFLNNFENIEIKKLIKIKNKRILYNKNINDRN